MRRRNSRWDNETPTYYGAFDNIAKLEAAVAHHTVVRNFTMEHVAEWMLPDDQIAALKQAFPYTHTSNRCDVYHATTDVNTFFRCTAIGMLRPYHVKLTGRHENITEAIAQTRAVHRQFEQVRRVVKWLDAYATLNAAKYYFPVVGSLLPVDHPYHSTKGTTYGEPKADMIKVIPLMRECSEIVAGALLCNREYEKGEAGFRVSFSGTRERLDGNGGKRYSSQSFALI